MLVSGAGLGGEKSGHVIVREHSTSGDGIITALELLRVMTAAGVPLEELASSIPLLPQQQRAIRVRHRDQWENDDVLLAAIADAERRLAPHGRILVRPSGTEPVLRVMIEGSDPEIVSALADAIAALVGERLH
jgi:phosphoglucosamine mutase